MSEYRPSVRTLVLVLVSFFAVIAPAIWFTGMGYMWFMEYGLKLDTTTKPETVADRLLVLVRAIPMIPLLLLAILISCIPWMFVMSRLLSWADIEHFTKGKGPQFPFLAAWLDRVWLRMIESRRAATSLGAPPS